MRLIIAFVPIAFLTACAASGPVTPTDDPLRMSGTQLMAAHNRGQGGAVYGGGIGGEAGESSDPYGGLAPSYGGSPIDFGTAQATPMPLDAAAGAPAGDKAAQKQAGGGAASSGGSAGQAGKTTASLGSLSQPQMSLETGLVSRQTQGTVTNLGNNRSATLTLIPSGKGASSGSQLSMDAMTALGADITEILDLDVKPN
ncbi:hypothetical protein ACMA5I_10580 [Paracoccaceae bacterium GXU_MW_L88]